MRKVVVLSITILIVCMLCGLIGIGIIRWQADVVTHWNFPLRSLWEYEVTEDVQAIAVDPNGPILIRTARSISSLDPKNGQLIWSADLPKTFGGGAPVISNNVAVVAHSEGVNAYNLQTGEQLWQVKGNTSRGHQTFVATANTTSVVVVGGVIAIYDLQTGESLWQVERASPGLGALATIDGNNLYVIFLNQIRNYDITNGKLIWVVETPLWSLRSMLFEDNVLYLENALQDGIGAFDVKTQKILWHQTGYIKTFSNPITKYGDYLFVPVEGYGPVALDTQTGEIKWRAIDLPNDTYLTSLVNNNVVYVKSLFHRNFYALDLKNGTVIGYLDLGWSSIFPSARSTSVGPFLLESSVIVFADKKRVFAYE